MILRHGRVVELGPTPLVFGDPRHPYTQTLLASVPQLRRKWSGGEKDNGSPDTLDDRLVDVGQGHLVAGAA
jgi:peptide/nickel transport system ATP-binding protein